MNKRLEENIKGLEEAILDHKKHIISLKECCKTLDELKDAAINDISKHKALMLTAVEELRKEKEEYRKIQEAPKETPKTDYDFIQDLIHDISNVVYDDFKVLTWSASVNICFHTVCQNVYKYNQPSKDVVRYALKYNIFEKAIHESDYNTIEYIATKSSEQARLYKLTNELITKLIDAGFLLHCYTDRHHGLSCGDTYIIEIWRERDNDE